MVGHEKVVDGVVVDVVEDVGIIRVHLGLVVGGEAKPSVRRQLKKERRCRELCCLGDQSGCGVMIHMKPAANVTTIINLPGTSCLGSRSDHQNRDKLHS